MINKRKGILVERVIDLGLAKQRGKVSFTVKLAKENGLHSNIFQKVFYELLIS